MGRPNGKSAASSADAAPTERLGVGFVPLIGRKPNFASCGNTTCNIARLHAAVVDLRRALARDKLGYAV